MKGQLLAGAVPGVVLFAAFVAATLWPRPVVSDDLKFAAGVVGWLEDQGIRVQSVYRWLHSPWTEGASAATIRTNVGLVQVVVLEDERASEAPAVVETSDGRSESGPYRYRLSGWPTTPDELTWESSYRWFFTRCKNWVLVAPDAAADRIIKRAVTSSADRGL